MCVVQLRYVSSAQMMLPPVIVGDRGASEGRASVRSRTAPLPPAASAISPKRGDPSQEPATTSAKRAAISNRR